MGAVIEYLLLLAATVIAVQIALRCFAADLAETHPPRRGDTPAEIPPGWTVEEYAHDGLRDLQDYLARRQRPDR